MPCSSRLARGPWTFPRLAGRFQGEPRHLNALTRRRPGSWSETVAWADEASRRRDRHVLVSVHLRPPRQRAFPGRQPAARAVQGARLLVRALPAHGPPSAARLKALGAAGPAEVRAGAALEVVTQDAQRAVPQFRRAKRAGVGGASGVHRAPATGAGGRWPAGKDPRGLENPARDKLAGWARSI